MRYLGFLIILLCGSTSWAAIDQDVAEITRKRIELEQLSLEMQKNTARLQQEVDLIQEKIQESKNAQLKERLKLVNLEQQMKNFSDSRSLDSGGLKLVEPQSELQALHKELKSFISQFSQKTFIKNSWQEMIDDLDVLYSRSQTAAYQIKLAQLLEKLVFDSNQIEYNFEAANLSGTPETVELMRLGHWLTVAKTPNAVWIYGDHGKFVKSDSSISEIVKDMIPQVKSRTLSFIPQNLLSVKNEKAKK